MRRRLAASITHTISQSSERRFVLWIRGVPAVRVAPWPQCLGVLGQLRGNSLCIHRKRLCFAFRAESCGIPALAATSWNRRFLAATRAGGDSGTLGRRVCGAEPPASVGSRHGQRRASRVAGSRRIALRRPLRRSGPVRHKELRSRFEASLPPRKHRIRLQGKLQIWCSNRKHGTSSTVSSIESHCTPFLPQPLQSAGD